MKMERLIYTVILCYFVSSVLITQSSAAVGADCTNKSTTVCVVASQEVCETNVCVCKTGFTNKAGTCTAFDCSSGDTCKNGGTCGASNAKTCTCVTGWKGDDCGRATLGVGCSSASICTVTNNEACDKGGKCACKPGFVDNFGTCKDINECLSNPCLNGASCTNSDGSCWRTIIRTAPLRSFDCTGVTNACKNGGTCEAGKRTCTCVAGYTGDDCGTAFDCKGGTDACKNGGTCPAGETSCSCVAGYTGDDCGTDVDECEPAPCLNGATCVDGVNSYTCTCVTGWIGTKCERAIVVACAGSPLACPATVDNSECFGKDCVCKEGYQKEKDNCVFVPGNSAGKIAMTAVTMLMAVLTNIIIQMF